MTGVTNHSVTVDGLRTAFVESGTGETLLLVHGITTYSFIWQEVLPLLASRYRVIALDLPGCGSSDKPLEISYALRDHAGFIRRFADALELPRFHYVGHDLGGGIGQIVAVRHPELLLDLTMINTVGYDLWPVQPIIAMRTPIVRQLIMASLDMGTFRLVVRRGLYHKEKLTAALMEDFMRPMESPDGRKAFLHFARSLDNRDLCSIAPAFGSLPMPVHIIRGEADPYLSSAIADRLHADIPGSRLSLIATGSHFLMIDEPEQTASLILEFLGESHD